MSLVALSLDQAHSASASPGGGPCALQTGRRRGASSAEGRAPPVLPGRAA